MENLIQEFNEMQKLPLFEISVFGKEGIDHLIFNISVENSCFMAQVEPLDTADSESDKIRCIYHQIDREFTLDENLAELYARCIDAIIDGDLYTLPRA